MSSAPAGPTCPKCSTVLKDDYGMINCPGCGAIVFVDMDGQAQVASDTPEPADPAPNQFAPLSEGDMSPPDLTPIDLAPMDLAPMSPEPFGAPVDTPALEASPAEDLGAMDMNAFLGYEPDPDAPKPAAASPDMSQIDPNDPLGISAYANSAMSSAPDGPLVVSLIISGIDAKDIRDEIRQALQDSRFGWDASVLMSGIKGGTLRIDRISPVKATVIINRIKNLSVQIHWEQNAITEIDPIEKEL